MTPHDQLLIDQLDNYMKGTLSADERLALENRMKKDDSFRQIAEEHFKFASALKQFGEREALRQLLNDYHQDLQEEHTPKQIPTVRMSGGSKIKRYWPTIAVAASVAFVSIMGTLISTTSLKKKQTADYKELRRNVEQIKKSQKAMMADLKEAKIKEEPLPVNYEGTGFLISADGYVATSYHVIRDADSVYLENTKFGRLKAEIVKADLKKDVAILRIKDSLFHATLPYNISREESFIGEDVFTLGYPREDIVYGEGAISSSTGYRRNALAYQISVPVNPGNSGGPLLNKQGQLIGIISGAQTETLGAAFAVKSAVLLDVIGDYPNDSSSLPILLPKQNKLKNLNRVDQLKKLQDFVFVVKVYYSK
jgi:S1-C subfamily serine protease